MSEEIESIIDMINTTSDSTLLINKLADLIQINDRDSKELKKLKLYMSALTDIVLKQNNDFRNMLKYLNIQGLISFDNEDMPSLETVDPDKLYI